jgi:hypothetical protein
MTRRRSSTSWRGLRPDAVPRAPFILRATVYVVEVFGGIGLLVMSLSTAVILPAMVGRFQLVVSQRMAC